MGFFSDIGDAVSSVASKAADIASDVVDTAVGAVADASVATINGAAAAGEAIGDVTGDIFSKAYQLADGAIDFTTANVPFAQDAWDLFKDAIGGTWDGVTKAGRAVGGVLEDGMDLLGSAILKADDIVNHPIRNAEEAVDTVTSLPGKVWDKAKKLVD